MMEPQPRAASLKRQFDEFDTSTDNLEEACSASKDPHYLQQKTATSRPKRMTRDPEERSVSTESDDDAEMDGEEEQRYDPAPILPGMTVASHTAHSSSTSTNSAPPPKRTRVKPPTVDKVQKAAEQAQKSIEHARAAAEKERKEREVAEAMAAKARTAVGDEALAKALAEKEKAENKVAKAKLASDQAAEKAAKEQQVARDLAQKVADKATKDQEKAAEKAIKDAEKLKKDTEKAKKDAEKAIKDAEKARKAAEKAAKEEAKRKSQMSLSSFFNVSVVPADGKTAKKTLRLSNLRTSMSPAPSIASNGDHLEVDEPEKPAILDYNVMFSDFFLKDETTLAPFTRFERDEETSNIVKITIDSYLSGSRSPGRDREYDAISLFHLARKPKRGRPCVAVKDLIAGITGRASHPIDLTIDDQNAEILNSRDILKRTPMKLIQFQEDVRPPYRGTYTHRPLHGARTLARNPFRKDLPDQNYDHDSEAEWVEGDDDAEDLGSEDDLDEDDDDEDMEDFLDDENDETAQAKKLLLQSDLEPVSTGLCWEDKHRRNTDVKMMPYRMEVIIDPKLKSIDPLSTSYWESSLKSKSMPPPRTPLNAMNPPNVKPAKTTSVKAFFAPTSDPTLSTATVNSQPSSKISKKTPSSSNTPKKFISDEDMPLFKSLIVGSQLSKIGLVEMLKSKFMHVNASVVSDTLVNIAHKVGKKRVDQHWILKETDDA